MDNALKRVIDRLALEKKLVGIVKATSDGFVSIRKFTETEVKKVNSKVSKVIKDLTKVDSRLEKIESIEVRDGKDGEKGSDGSKGDKGDVGKPGLDGKPGVDGLKGNNGEDGSDGKDGEDGKDGVTKIIKTTKQVPIKGDDLRELAADLTEIPRKYKMTVKALRDYREETIKIATSVRKATDYPVDSVNGEIDHVIINQFSAGMIEPLPTWTDNGDGTFSITAGQANLFKNALYSGVIKTYTLAALENYELTDGVTSYLVADYNGGSPTYKVITDVLLINESDVIPVQTLYRNNLVIIHLDWDALGEGLSNKLHARFVKTDRFARQSGLGISEFGTRNLLIEAGIVWNGAVPLDIDEVDTTVDPFSLWYRDSGVWTQLPSQTQYSNSQYDDGTDLQTLSPGKYVVNWIYRQDGVIGRAGMILSDSINTIAEAEAEQPPSNLPSSVASHGFLVGRVIVKQGATEGDVASAFDVVFASGAVSSLAAAQVTVADAEDHFVGSDVEAVLAEIGETEFHNGFDRQTALSLPDLSWDNGTRKLTASVKSGADDFYFWAHGKKFSKATTQELIINDVTGTYYAYFDNNGDIQYVDQTALQAEVFYENAIVAVIYWNATASTGQAGYELHGIRMSASTHHYNHDTFGARYASGMNITGLTDGSDVYTNIEGGTFWDEDIQHVVALHTNTPFIYRFGANGDWNGTTPDLKVSYNNGGSYDVWNEWTGSTWQLTEGTVLHRYWIQFLVVTPDMSGYSYKKIIGQSSYSSRSAARNAIESERGRLVTDGLPSPEFAFLYAWIVTRSGDIEDDGDGNSYYDLRTERGGVAGTSTQASIAGNVVADVANFDKILSSADTNVQLALETIDGLTPAQIGAKEVFTSANTFYVDSVNGDDTTGDGSSGNPWETPQHAVDYITPYDNAGYNQTIQLADNYSAQSATRARTSGVVTIVTQAPHGLITGDNCSILGFDVALYDKVGKTVTVIDSITFTYVYAGANEATATDTNGFVYKLENYYGAIVCKSYTGSGTLIIQGNSADRRYVLSRATGSNVTLNFTLGFYGFKDMKFIDGTYAINNTGSYVTLDNVDFGGLGTLGVYSVSGAFVQVLNKLWLSGDIAYILYTSGGKLRLNNVPVEITKPMVVSVAFAYSKAGWGMYVKGATFINPANITGKRYDVTTNATIDTNGGGINFFPGTVAGTDDGSGQYV